MALPTQHSNNNNTYLFPHIDPAGVVYTSLINYDAEQGINWLTLECVAQFLFGDAPETDKAEEAKP